MKTEERLARLASSISVGPSFPNVLANTVPGSTTNQKIIMKNDRWKDFIDQYRIYISGDTAGSIANRIPFGTVNGESQCDQRFGCTRNVSLSSTSKSIMWPVLYSADTLRRTTRANIIIKCEYGFRSERVHFYRFGFGWSGRWSTENGTWSTFDS